MDTGTMMATTTATTEGETALTRVQATRAYLSAMSRLDDELMTAKARLLHDGDDDFEAMERAVLLTNYLHRAVAITARCGLSYAQRIAVMQVWERRTCRARDAERRLLAAIFGVRQSVGRDPIWRPVAAYLRATRVA